MNKEYTVLTIQARENDAPLIEFAESKGDDDGTLVIGARRTTYREFLSCKWLEYGSINSDYLMVVNEEIDRVGYSIRVRRNLIAGSCIVERRDESPMTDQDVKVLTALGVIIPVHSPELQTEFDLLLAANPGPYMTVFDMTDIFERLQSIKVKENTSDKKEVRND